jgi:hypothetical protein
VSADSRRRERRITSTKSVNQQKKWLWESSSLPQHLLGAFRTSKNVGPLYQAAKYVLNLLHRHMGSTTGHCYIRSPISSPLRHGPPQQHSILSTSLRLSLVLLTLCITSSSLYSGALLELLAAEHVVSLSFL